MSETAAIPLRVYSIYFAYPGNTGAIQMKNPGTNEFIATQPEWQTGGVSKPQPAAYVRGAQPTIQVVFTQNQAGAPGTYIIGARSLAGDIEIAPQSVDISFNPNTALTNPIEFKFGSPLPNQIGVNQISWQWYITTPQTQLPISTTNHTIYTTWHKILPTINTPGEWTYLPLMQWTCQWAAGQDNEKAICDAIIGNVAKSGLTYGLMEFNVRDMLLNGGGMCSGWYKMFQAMAACQGVFVERRCFLVDWRTLDQEQVQWNAIVVTIPGLNLSEPVEEITPFHDNNDQFPIVEEVPINNLDAKRWRFWGKPDGYSDGHCINFLEYQGQLFLYDCCFQQVSIQIDMPLPPKDLSILGGEQLASFKQNYLNNSVEYMLGSLYDGTQFYQSIGPPPDAMTDDSAVNGMTVKTAIIPDEDNGFPEITFYWGP